MTPTTIRVRSASPPDVPAMAALLGELGYPATAGEVDARLRVLLSSAQATAIVAESDDGRVIGLATGHVIQSIHGTPPTAWLTTLVVSADSHNCGIGRRLTTAIEDWARQSGAVRLSVTSGKHRDGAHAFYEHIGYERTGIRFAKVLERPLNAAP